MLAYIRLQENHAHEVKKVKAEVEDLRCRLAQSQNESQSLKSELQAQKEANSRAPTTTMKNLVERLKSQLVLKEKQQKVSNNKKLSTFRKKCDDCFESKPVKDDGIPPQSGGRACIRKNRSFILCC